MLLQTASQLCGIVVVVVLNRVAKGLVILLLDQKIVDGLVHNTLVLRLHVQQERLDERKVVVLLEDLDNTVDIDTGSESGEEVSEERRMLLNVELDSTVVDFQVGHLDHNLLELLVVPRVLGSLNDGKSSVVKFIIMVVAENKLGPKVSLFAGLDHLGQIHARPEDLNMLHQTVRVVLGESNTKLSEHSHVSTLEAKTLLEKADELIEVTVALVLLNQSLKLLSIDNQVETTNLGKAELLLLHTGFVDLLPHLDVVGLASALDGSLVVTKMDKGSGQLSPVRDASVEDLRSLVQAFLICLVTRLLDLLETSVREGESCVNSSLAVGLASHAQVFDELLVLTSVCGDFDDLKVVSGVLSLDVRLDGIGNAEAVKLCLGNLAPDLREINLLSICLSTIDADNVLNQDIDSGRLVVGLLINLERFFKQTNLDTASGDFIGIVVIELVDIVHHTSLVSLGGSEHEQVLEVLVVTEGTTVNVVLAQNEAPELSIGALQEVSSLSPVHGVLVGDVDKLKIILALGVGDVGQVGITLLTVLSNSKGIVLVVLLEELLGVVVGVDIDLGKSVVHSLLLVTSLESGLEERQKQLKAVARLNF
ncbi:hypothetical protein HG531_002929 [Fusarium graminearum]|nr:hypothetical protein HG531_002929 [Fusarium graminearum]